MKIELTPGTRQHSRNTLHWPNTCLGRWKAGEIEDSIEWSEFAEEMKSSKASKACENCGTLRDCHPIYRRGYCKDCYILLQRKKQIEAWDWDNPATLKGYPKAYPWPRSVPSRIPEDSWMHPRKEFQNVKERELKKNQRSLALFAEPRI